MKPIGTGDLARAAKLLTLMPLSWLLPMESLLPLARKLRPLRGGAEDDRARAQAALARLISDHVTAPQAAEIIWSLSDRMVEAQMQILALHRPARRWRPEIRWHGFDNVTQALERRSGAILWIGDFVYSSLVTKMAFHEAGVAVSHLSRPIHGFSISWFGVRFLNPLVTDIEDRFIAKRVLIESEGAGDALKVLRAHLAENRVVSITVSDTARRTLETAFFRETIRIASGPPHLSHASRAPLLPVFTVRADDGIYDVTIAKPLDVDAGSR